jgi:hypothetical protein
MVYLDPAGEEPAGVPDFAPVYRYLEFFSTTHWATCGITIG